MKTWKGKLDLDKRLVNEMAKYYIYRSVEQAGSRPIIDGVYVQCASLGKNPPEQMTLSLEWEEEKS